MKVATGNRDTQSKLNLFSSVQVWNGSSKFTKGGLTKDDLMKNSRCGILKLSLSVEVDVVQNRCFAAHTVLFDVRGTFGIVQECVNL